MSYQSDTALRNVAATTCRGVKSRSESGGRKTGGGGALGRKRQYFHPEGGREANRKAKKPSQSRRERFADQRQAASIYRSYEARLAEQAAPLHVLNRLAGRGVCLCGWTQIADIETSLKRVRREDGWHAFLSGAQMCGLRWVCPVCTHKRGEEDRQAINDGLAAARAIPGLHPVMLTLTTRHHAREAASDVLDGITRAEQRLKRLKVWTRLSEEMEGYARVLEWTHGRNGHHPHYHGILLVRAESEEAAINKVRQLQPAYMRQLTSAGRDGASRAAWERSFQVQGAAAAAQYVTKWGMAEEMTGAASKASVTPWRLLRLSRTAETHTERQRSAALWWEIIQATKGKTQLHKSSGWKALVEKYRADQEIEPESVPEIVDTFGIRGSGEEATSKWRRARSRTLGIREAAEAAEDLATARAGVRQAMASGPTDADILREMDDDDDGQVIDDDWSDAIDLPAPTPISLSVAAVASAAVRPPPGQGP